MILFGLVISSYGFLIYAQENSDSSTNILSSANSDSGTNLTKEVAQKISAITANTDANPEVSIDEIKNIVDESLSSQEDAFILPEMSGIKLNIKKQDYSKYSAAVAKEKEKEDSVEYATKLFYIFNSNSIKPVTSLNEMPSFFESLPSIIIPAITTGDTSALDQFSASGEKILEQMKDIEVPEKLIDTHIKIMQFARYATSLKNLIANQDPSDPLKTLSDLSKISGFLGSLSGFSVEASQIFKDYIPENDAAMISQLEKYGITINPNAATESETK